MEINCDQSSMSPHICNVLLIYLMWSESLWTDDHSQSESLLISADGDSQTIPRKKTAFIIVSHDISRSQLILCHEPTASWLLIHFLYFVSHCRQMAMLPQPHTCSEPCLHSFQMKKWFSISSSNPFYPIAEFNYSSRWVSKLQPSMITVPQRSEHCQALCWISRTRLRPHKSIEQSILSEAWSWPGLLACS